MKKQVGGIKMNYEQIKKRIEIITDRIRELGGEVAEIIIADPATREHIRKTEQKLGVSLPDSFKKVLTEFTGHFSLRWFLPDDIEHSEEFQEIFCGTPHWSLDLLVQCEEDRKSSIDGLFPNPEDPYDVVWHNKLAFCEVGDGDLLAFDMKDGTADAPIVYLSYGDGKGHGYTIANNFMELIENWSRIGFVGCEDSQWLPFTTSPTSGIVPDGEAAMRFRAWLGLNV